LLPLLSIIKDPKICAELRSVGRAAQGNLVAERGLLAEAQILEILSELMTTLDRTVVPVADVATELAQRYGTEYERPITNRWIGSILRKRLNLQTYKSHGVYVVPMTERTKVELLCGRYGVNVLTGAVELGDVGTTGTA
jgi:hypothetical protein